MDSLLHDLRYGSRMLVKSGRVTIVALLSLALGIGATTTLFSLVKATLIDPLPYREADRLMHLWETRQGRDGRREASYPNFLDWREQATSFEGIAGYNGVRANVMTDSGAERILGSEVNANFFPLLGVEPVLGRLFTADEEREERAVLLLDHGYWMRLGSDPGVIGRTLTLSGIPYEVIGVLPPGFHFAPAGPSKFWIPLTVNENQRQRRGMHWLDTIARLRDGVTREQAETELDAIQHRLAAVYPDTNAETGARISPLRDEIVGTVRPAVLVLFGAVTLLLLIACANVANLLLTRSVSRQRELAIRMALGAGRGRLLRLLLTESVLLSLIGGGLGLVASAWGIEAVKAAIPASIAGATPFLQDLRIDRTVLVFASAISVLTGLLFGLAPAWQTTRVDMNESLKDGARSSLGGERHRLLRLLAVSEVALAMILLVGTGLMARSLTRLLAVDPGFRTQNLLTLRVSLPGSRYDDTRAFQFHKELLDRTEALPGVTTAGAVDILPLTGGGNTLYLGVVGQPPPRPGEEVEVRIRNTSTGYFRSLGIPLESGRDFDERDYSDETLVCILNDLAAQRLFAGEDPVGRQVYWTRDPNTPIDVVGVVGSVNIVSLDSSRKPAMYAAGLAHSMTFTVRTAGDPRALVPAIRSEVRSMDPELPVYAVQTMDELIGTSQAVTLRRYPSALMGAFASVAMLLACIGIYGVISFSVGQRTREIGVRMALGARRGDVLRDVLAGGLRLALLGILFGVAGSLALTRLLSGLLFGVSATDPAIYAIVPLLLVLVAAAACWLPARQATRINPVVALRHE